MAAQPGKEVTVGYGRDLALCRYTVIEDCQRQFSIVCDSLQTIRIIFILPLDRSHIITES